jgi:biotin synthase-like enzyme
MSKPLSFEQGPIRPPSEAHSLLLRFTRNCSWNKCLFCPVYKNRKFSRRSVDEVKADIDIAAEMIDHIKEVSWKMGASGRVTREVAQAFFNEELPQSHLSVVAWMYYQTGAVFLQDANNLILATDKLVQMLEYLHEKIQGITRVTSYSRSATVARKTQEELIRIREAGLNRIHIGLESGCDPVLDFMRKGVTGEVHIQAGQKIKAAGMELSEYYMPGLGGREHWKEHAIESAKVINAIDPDFIRLRTLRIPDRTDLYPKLVNGDFQMLTDDEVVEEIRLFIENLDGIHSYFASDHIMNLLQDVEGTLPRDKGFLLEVIDRYLSLNPEERLHYRLGRRMGLYHGVADMARPELSQRVEKALAQIQEQHPDDVESVLTELANTMI